ncbi:MAG: type II toxin-antitoxin system VapC family toxin [Chloroflexota bacterium]
MFVVDASVALAWCFEDEHSEAADRVLGRLATEPAVAPAIWPLELANAFRTAERRGRLTIADGARLRDMLLRLPISVESTPLSAALGEVTELARACELSAYDAAYLSLAAARGYPLATADERLADAARLAGVDLLI